MKQETIKSTLEEHERNEEKTFAEMRAEIKRLSEDMRAVQIACAHQEPSAKTLMMFDTIKDENKKFHRVLFGDKETGEVGMQQMVKEMYTKIVQVNGLVGFFKLFMILGGVSGMLYAFFKKI